MLGIMLLLDRQVLRYNPCLLSYMFEETSEHLRRESLATNRIQNTSCFFKTLFKHYLKTFLEP